MQKCLKCRASITVRKPWSKLKVLAGFMRNQYYKDKVGCGKDGQGI